MRRFLRSEDDQRAWQAEAASDKIQVLEALIELATPESAGAAKIIQGEILRIKELLSTHKLPENKKPPIVADLAKDVGLENENRAFYKLFSKLVHPSSLLVNESSFSRSSETRDLLLINLQLYSWDTVERVKDRFDVPDRVVYRHSGTKGA